MTQETSSMSEREPRPNDTPLDSALRNYSISLYKLKNEGEASYEPRFIYALTTLTDLLDQFSPYLSDIDKIRLRDRLMTNNLSLTADEPTFQDKFATLRLAPLRLIAGDYIPLESLTPRTIDLCMNTAVRLDEVQHTECIDDSEELSCAIQYVCPAKTARVLGIDLLNMLTVHMSFGVTDDAIALEKARYNAEAIAERLIRLRLMTEGELETTRLRHHQQLVNSYHDLLAEMKQENPDSDT